MNDPLIYAPSFVNYKKGALDSATSDKVYQLLAHGRWFSSDTPASSTTKTGRHDIAEILLKVALNTKNQINTPITSTSTYRFYLAIAVFVKCQQVIKAVLYM